MKKRDDHAENNHDKLENEEKKEHRRGGAGVAVSGREKELERESK